MTSLSMEDFKNEVQKVQDFLTKNELLPSVINQDDSSIMFPPIPSNPFPDAYPEKGYPDGRPKQEKHQMEYEAEVNVFRALENLKHGLVVVQSFEYITGQNSLFTDNKGKGGESDFVILGNDFCVILEVKLLMNLSWFIENSDPKIKKSPEDRRKLALKRHLHDGRDQGIKTLNIITDMLKCFNHEMRISNTTIIEGLDREQAKAILGEEDTTNLFGVLFSGDSTNKPCSSPDLEGHLSELFRTTSDNMVVQAVSILPILTLWCMNSNNKCNLSDFDLCDLIKKIDIKLRRSQITKNIKKNPRVVGPPNIFKEFLGIENLTKEQKDIFKSPEKVRKITGQAGSGKTILMLGKIIELAKMENSRKSLLIVSNKDQVTRCMEIINNKVGIPTVTEYLSHYEMPDIQVRSNLGFLYDIVARSDPDVKVIIVEAPAQPWEGNLHIWFVKSLERLITSLDKAGSMINVFIDDYKIQTENSSLYQLDSFEYEKCAYFVKKGNCFIWTAADPYQDFLRVCDKGQIPGSLLFDISLTLNIRNSISIASVAVILREALHLILNAEISLLPGLLTTVYEQVIERVLQRLPTTVYEQEMKRILQELPTPVYRQVIERVLMRLDTTVYRQEIERTLTRLDTTVIIRELKSKLSFPIQNVGHTIHGAKVIIRMIEDKPDDIIRGIIKGELKKLATLDNEELGLIYNHEPDMQLLLPSNEDRRTCTNLRGICSSEWPAVVAIIDSDLIAEVIPAEYRSPSWMTLWALYSTISRARVYCTVILTNVACLKEVELEIINLIFGEFNAHVNYVSKYPPRV